MTKRELVRLLEVERHMPSPRPPQFHATRYEPPKPLTAEDQERNRALLLAGLDGDVVVVDFYERKGA